MSTSAGSRTIFSSRTRVASSSMGRNNRSVISSSDNVFSAVLCLAMIARTAGLACGFDRFPSLIQNLRTCDLPRWGWP